MFMKMSIFYIFIVFILYRQDIPELSRNISGIVDKFVVEFCNKTMLIYFTLLYFSISNNKYFCNYNLYIPFYSSKVAVITAHF